jgi:transcriptional regulator with XRE-family HTH domain
MKTALPPTLDPKVIGFWTRCLRVSSKWSQDALAVASNLDIRTIQRIEAGQSVNVTTRRALARGLGYQDNAIFDTPEFIENVQKIITGAQTEQLKAAKQIPSGSC